MNKIDIVYKIGIKSQWDNYEELRYSIRSFVKNFKNLGNIYIIGHKPEWVQNVKHIECSDPYKHNKDANLILKLIIPCLDKDLSDDYLNLSDDYFAIKPFDISFFDFAIIYNEPLKNIAEKQSKNQGINKWEARIKSSIEALKEKGFEGNCFESHMPVLYNKNLYPKTILQYSWGEGFGMVGNTLYFNSINAKSRSVEKSDLLRITHISSSGRLNDNDYTFLNISSKVCVNEIKTFLQNKFPEKTKFER
jgi:hypothetical protein